MRTPPPEISGAREGNQSCLSHHRRVKNRVRKEYALEHMHSRLRAQQQASAKEAIEAGRAAEKLRLAMEHVQRDSSETESTTESAARFIDAKITERMARRRDEIAKMEDDALSNNMMEALERQLKNGITDVI